MSPPLSLPLLSPLPPSPPSLSSSLPLPPSLPSLSLSLSLSPCPSLPSLSIPLPALYPSLSPCPPSIPLYSPARPSLLSVSLHRSVRCNICIIILNMCTMHVATLISGAILSCPGALVRRYKGHTAHVLSLYPHAESGRFVSGGQDKMALMWDVRMSVPVQTYSSTSDLGLCLLASQVSVASEML